MSEILVDPSRPGANFLNGLSKLQRQIAKLGVESLVADTFHDSDLANMRKQAIFVSRWTFPPSGGLLSGESDTQRAGALARGLVVGALAGHSSVPPRLETNFLEYLSQYLNIDEGVFGIELCSDPIESEIAPNFLDPSFTAHFPVIQTTEMQDVFNLGVSFMADKTERYHQLVKINGVKKIGRKALAYRRGMKKDARSIRYLGGLSVAELPPDMQAPPNTAC